MEELAKYLLEKIDIDFQGDISVEVVKDYLRKDGSPLAKKLLDKIIEEKGVDELLITLADCLKENLTTGINGEVIEESLNMYADS